MQRRPPRVAFAGGVHDGWLEFPRDSVIFDGYHDALASGQDHGNRYAVAKTRPQADSFRLAPGGSVVERPHHGDLLLGGVGVRLFIGEEELDLAGRQLDLGRFPATRAGIDSRFVDQPAAFPRGVVILAHGGHDSERVYAVAGPLVVGEQNPAVLERQHFRVRRASELVRSHRRFLFPGAPFVPARTHVDPAATFVGTENLLIGQTHHAPIDSACLHQRERRRVPDQARRRSIVGHLLRRKATGQEESRGSHRKAFHGGHRSSAFISRRARESNFGLRSYVINPLTSCSTSVNCV